MLTKCILVVDDDKMNLMRTKKILEKTYAVLPRCPRIPTHSLPSPTEYVLPVIFLTASGDADDVMRAIELGAANYLKKPFYPQELLKRVAKELDLK